MVNKKIYHTWVNLHQVPNIPICSPLFTAGPPTKPPNARWTGPSQEVLPWGYWLVDVRYVFLVALPNQVYQQKFTTHVTLNFPLYPKTHVCWVKLYQIPMESQQKSMVKSPCLVVKPSLFLMGWAPPETSSDRHRKWRSRVIVGISWVLMWETCHKPSGDEIYHLWWWLGHCFFLGLPH